MTFKRNIQSKVLMIYTIQDEAKETDQKLFSTTFKKFKYVSFKLSSSLQRLAAMHSNEMKNPKAKYETLFEIQLKDKALYQGTEYTLKELIDQVQIKDIPLFLAIEQGTGKNSRHTQVVINPKVRNRAK